MLLGVNQGIGGMFEGAMLAEPVLENCVTDSSPGSSSGLNRAREAGKNEQGWTSQS